LTTAGAAFLPFVVPPDRAAGRKAREGPAALPSARFAELRGDFAVLFRRAVFLFAVFGDAAFFFCFFAVAGFRFAGAAFARTRAPLRTLFAVGFLTAFFLRVATTISFLLRTRFVGIST
jgi:hypothetical protein